MKLSKAYRFPAPPIRTRRFLPRPAGPEAATSTDRRVPETLPTRFQAPPRKAAWLAPEAGEGARRCVLSPSTFHYYDNSWNNDRFAHSLSSFREVSGCLQTERSLRPC